MTAATPLSDPGVDAAVPLLQISGLSHHYGDHRVLQGVGLSLRAGEVLGLMGANGVGKSTLAAILGGAFEPEHGVIEVRGTPVDARERRTSPTSHVAVLEQRIQIAPELTVAQALFRHTDRRDDPPHTLTGPARHLLISVGVALEPTDRIGDLGRAEVSMVEAARLLASPAPITVIDEVSAALNPRELDELHYILSRLVREGRGVLYITHKPEEALRLCDRVAILRGGSIVDVFDSQWADPAALVRSAFGDVVPTEDADERLTHRAEIVVQVRDVYCGADVPVGFDIHAGEVVGLVGSRGAGLPRIVDALSGDAPQPTTRLWLADEEHVISSPASSVSAGIAFLSSAPDRPGVHPDLLEARSMLIGGPMPAASDEEVDAMADILGQVRAADARRRELTRTPPLSGGQAQWERLEHVLGAPSRLAILDEPAQALDLPTRERLRSALTAVSERGGAVLLVASDPDDLFALTDRLIVVEEGRITHQWATATADRAHVEHVLRGS